VVQHVEPAQRRDRAVDDLRVGVQVQIGADGEVHEVVTVGHGEDAVGEVTNDAGHSVRLGHVPEGVADADELVVVAVAVRGGDGLAVAHELTSVGW